MKQTNIESLLAEFDAQLPETKAEVAGRRQPPVGKHHGVLTNVRPGIYERDGAGVPYVNFVFKILSTQGEGDRHRNRLYFHFASLDPTDPEARGKFKGLAKALGLPEDMQNSATKLIAALEDPKVYATKHGNLPTLEFQLKSGTRPNKKGEIPVFFNFIRLLELSELGTWDGEAPSTIADDLVAGTPLEAPKIHEPEPGAPEEEVPEFPSVAEVDTISIDEVRKTLTHSYVGCDASKLAGEEDTLRDACRIALGILLEEQEIDWSKDAALVLAGGLGIEGKTLKDLKPAITQKIITNASA